MNYNRGAYGYYGNQASDNCARNQVLSYGGQSLFRILYVNSKGYRTIAVSRQEGEVKVGAAAGYSSQSDANARAMLECKSRGGGSCRVERTWIDR